MIHFRNLLTIKDINSTLGTYKLSRFRLDFSWTPTPYFFEYKNNLLDKNTQKMDIGKNENKERVHIGERIRDMIIYKDKLYLFLEDSASFAEITFK